MSPRTAQQFEHLREESRAKIIAAALAVFAKHGYEHASVRMIAQEAGIAQGLMYRYFAGKEELLRAIFARSMQDVRASFAAAAQDGTPQQKLERLIRASFAIVGHNMHFWRLLYGVRMQAAVLAGLGDDLSGWTASICQTLADLLRDAGAADPASEAEVLFALIDGIAQHYVLEPERYPLEQVVAAVVARYCKE